MDIHAKLMRAYDQVPTWWFHIVLLSSIGLSIFACEYYKESLQLPWWGVLFSCAIAFLFTLPVGVIQATTNLLVGAIVSVAVYTGTAWWMMSTIPHLCDLSELPPNSPWTCKMDTTFYDASVIWGLIGSRRIFGDLGYYTKINWFFLIGAVAPCLVYLAIRVFPNQKWIRSINMPVIFGAVMMIPPASAVNYTSWIVVAFFTGFVMFRYRPRWWERYNYILSGGLDAGTAFMTILGLF